LRYNSAVSEVLGAIFLIGIVVVAFTVIGAYLMSSTPNQSGKFPTATVGSYCVECEGTYEIILKHDGGDAFPTKETTFKVNYPDRSENVDPSSIDVFTKEPPECSSKASASATGGEKYNWGSFASFGPGMIAKITIDKKINETETDTPTGITILNNGQTGPGGVGSQTFERVKEETGAHYDESTGNETQVMGELMTGTFEPELNTSSVAGPDDSGYCTATFYYDNSLDLKVKLNPCSDSSPMIVDKNGNKISGSACQQPWNEFVGVGSSGDDFSFLKKDMGQFKEFQKNEDTNQANRSFTVKYKTGIQWRLGNTVSSTAYCESNACNCDSQETCLWGYMYFDANNNGVRDTGEYGFSNGSVDIYYRYKNGDKIGDRTGVKVTKNVSQNGLWKSNCIQMSGTAFDIVANLPSGYTTDDSYMGYNDKMTGTDKKNPPRLDFGVYTGSTTSAIPVDSSGVGAQLFSADSTSDVIVEYTFAEAWYNNSFRLDDPRIIQIGSSKKSTYGETWNLGNITAGQELIFSDSVYDPNATQDKGTYFTGPASRNVDNVAHGAVSLISSSGAYKKYLISFEDSTDTGSFDWNDVEFYVSGNLYVSNASASSSGSPSDNTRPTVYGVSASQSNKGTKPVTIGWTAQDAIGVTKIEIWLSENGGLFNQNIISSVWNPANTTGSYVWQPNRAYQKAKFKVIAYDTARNAGIATTSSSLNIQK